MRDKPFSPVAATSVLLHPLPLRLPPPRHSLSASRDPQPHSGSASLLPSSGGGACDRDRRRPDSPAPFSHSRHFFLLHLSPIPRSAVAAVAVFPAVLESLGQMRGRERTHAPSRDRCCLYIVASPLRAAFFSRGEGTGF